MSTQAATPAETRIDRLSPDSLVASFSQSHLVRWFLVAFALHTVVIGAFSIGYVRDLIDPVGAAARKAEVIAAAAAAAAPPADPAAKPGDGKTPQSAEKSDGKSAEKSPIEKATSEAAKPDEIPATPDDLGLSIEDTNPE